LGVVGASEGLGVGFVIGFAEGLDVGFTDGVVEGLEDGLTVGIAVGLSVVGSTVGLPVGNTVRFLKQRFEHRRCDFFRRLTHLHFLLQPLSTTFNHFFPPTLPYPIAPLQCLYIHMLGQAFFLQMLPVLVQRQLLHPSE